MRSPAEVQATSLGRIAVQAILLNHSSSNNQ